MKPIEIYQQQRETDILKMCQHPNINRLIDLFDGVSYTFIVLEQIHGKNLYDYMKTRNFKLPEDRAREITLQLASAIQYLQIFGIAHRDLKLENIMMTDHGNSAVPKIIDFGLSRVIGPNQTTIEPFGTLGYVAPEVLKQDPYSFTCDIWSLGCITYAMLSGSLPFDH